ncbi:hypothetical protein CN138_22170 [Sinorhizobium meliloti]|nr:hypothetical protein BWO76_01480 [Sinorhizobium meliloti]ATB00898.1 hypothetical protein BWO90_01405 [Sinorhizobium meliloti]RVE93302.1 hypothetical protein CN235_16365 [Sinorhizobium meliloti]RVG12649.1 hypothetical protein CN234_08640 [Sinorhizobium meliloti]RVG52191.1 hypothetical protein CN226_16110 [Sinorhizobium meliloti]
MFQTRHWTGRTAKVSGRLDGFGAFVPNLDGTDTPTPYRLTPASRDQALAVCWCAATRQRPSRLT